MGVAVLGGLEIPPDKQKSQEALLAPQRTGPSKVGDAVTPPDHWSISGALSRGCSQQDLPRRSFFGHSEHMAEPT